MNTNTNTNTDTNTNTNTNTNNNTTPAESGSYPTGMRGSIGRACRRFGRGQTRRRAVRTLATSLAVAVSATVIAPTVANAAASWIYVDGDKVLEEGWSAKVWGNVHFWKASNNKNHRYMQYSIGALQRTGPYVPMCVGTKIMVRTETTSSTTGGSVGGSWGLTGPSASGSVSYSRTKLGGTTSDGFHWKCPKNNTSYVRDYASGGRSFHPTMDGKLTHVGFKACLSDDPANPNRRWCTPWDVNAYGGS